MKKFFIVFILMAATISSCFAKELDSRWMLVGKDSPNKNSWYVDRDTMKIQKNNDVLFWAKIVLGNPKYDITEINLKYLLSADRLQLAKMQEIGYDSNKAILWNTNTTETISVIPGSGQEKLVAFIDDFINKQEEEKRQEEARKEKQRRQAEKEQQEQEQKQLTKNSAALPADEKQEENAAVTADDAAAN